MRRLPPLLLALAGCHWVLPLGEPTGDVATTAEQGPPRDARLDPGLLADQRSDRPAQDAAPLCLRDDFTQDRPGWKVTPTKGTWVWQPNTARQTDPTHPGAHAFIKGSGPMVAGPAALVATVDLQVSQIGSTEGGAGVSLLLGSVPNPSVPDAQTGCMVWLDASSTKIATVTWDGPMTSSGSSNAYNSPMTNFPVTLELRVTPTGDTWTQECRIPGVVGPLSWGITKPGQVPLGLGLLTANAAASFDRFEVCPQ